MGRLAWRGRLRKIIFFCNWSGSSGLTGILMIQIINRNHKLENRQWTGHLETEEYKAKKKTPNNKILDCPLGHFLAPLGLDPESGLDSAGAWRKPWDHMSWEQPGPQCRGAGRCQWLQGGPTLHPPKRRRRRGVGCGQAVTPIVPKLPPKFTAWWVLFCGAFIPVSTQQITVGFNQCPIHQTAIK